MKGRGGAHEKRVFERRGVTEKRGWLKEFWRQTFKKNVCSQIKMNGIPNVKERRN